MELREEFGGTGIVERTEEYNTWLTSFKKENLNSVCKSCKKNAPNTGKSLCEDCYKQLKHKK